MSMIADLDRKYDRAMLMLRASARRRGIHPKELLIRAIFQETGQSFPLYADEPRADGGQNIKVTHQDIRA